MAKKSQSTPAFEQEIQSLEQIIQTLDRGDLTLDDALRAYEDGVKRIALCQQMLKSAEQKIQQLQNKETP